MNLRKLADYLDNKIYYMLLFTVAVIPLRQEFTAFCVAVTFIAAVLTSFYKGRKNPPVLQKWQQGALYLLFIIGWISLHFSLDKFISYWNYVYVAGQYSALLFVLLRYGWQKPQPFAESAKETETINGWRGYWQQFSCLPRPLQLISAFMLMSVFVSGLGIFQKIFGVTADGVWVDPAQFPDIKVRVFSTLVNPNILGGYLVLVIAYTAAFFNMTKGRRNWRLAFLATGILASICLLYTYSRGNWLACAAVLLTFCICFCRKAFIPIIMGSVAVFASGGHVVMHRLASIGGSGDTSTALRLAYLKSTKWIIEAYPFGVGWYGYRFVYPTYNFYLADTSVIMYHCHNMFLNVWSELGLHGLIVFLLIWWGIFLRTGWRLAYHGRSWWLKAMGRGYVLASIGITIGGLTDHVYFNTQMGLLFWLLGGLTMLSNKLDKYEM